jgi:uncharacterized membrane protein YfcA
MALTLVPDPGVVLILVGVLPWLARIVPNLKGLDINRPSTSIACGAIVTSAQLIAGASGPLLDVFYLNSTLSRHQIVASKALTQTLGHLIKLGYYGVFIGVVENMAAWFYLAAMATAVLGARIGTRLLDKIEDDTFRRVSGSVILAIAGICIISGVLEFVS